MSLLVSGVFGDKMEVLAADNEGSVHLGGDNSACEDTATDRDFASEGAFFVCAPTGQMTGFFLRTTLVPEFLVGFVPM